MKRSVLKNNEIPVAPGMATGCLYYEKATWCKIRVCATDRGYATCAECDVFADVNQCKKFNTFMSKIFAFIFKSDRRASIHLIGEVGVQEYAKVMAEKSQSVLKKR